MSSAKKTTKNRKRDQQKDKTKQQKTSKLHPLFIILAVVVVLYLFHQSSQSSRQNKEQVIATVNVSYGGYKPNQSLKFNPDYIKLVNPLSELKTDQLSAPVPASQLSSRLVTSDDLVEIIGHFSCPCDQCGIPELINCNCNHPRGATEVKIFIDQKIDEQKYTIAHVVDLVEKQYGHKIR